MVPAIQAAAQVVHLAAFVVVLNVDPATQDGHPVFAKAVQAVDRYVPAGQMLQAVQTRFTETLQAVDWYVDPAIQAAAHAVQLAALVTVLKVDPATQEGQAVFAVTVQAVDRYVPAAHTVQAVQLAAFVTVLYVDPATQAVQTLFVVTEHAVEA